MKILLRVLGGGCLLIAVPFLILMVAIFFQSNPSEEEQSAAWGGALLGVPPALLGITLLVVANRIQSQAAKAEEDPLRRQFFELLEAQNYRITVLQWSRAAGVSGEEAKEFLDARSREFGADFEVGDAGQIIYIFPA
ncbi:hypothetical protein [Leptolyngbya sp. PCC 6406]|uniref:hypothetical protein n=1 Tax=Leptolyngbya sp. PCC 6406 TaxID=1173264 RepID=UPI0002ACEB02|nr:hypothetical protein [Leptolyngbya sp. PCC 6406]